MTVFYGILLPFLGTVLGAGCVFFLKKSLGLRVQRALTGFAPKELNTAFDMSLSRHLHRIWLPGAVPLLLRQ